jgi:DNA/RNA-binding domain of Phe-tRNA-synthetase-like protein
VQLPPFIDRPEDVLLASDPRPDPGWVAPDVAEELPGLELFSWSTPTEYRRRSPDAVRDWLGRLSTRVDGQAVLRAHRDEAPAAHRELLRRIGRDPDEDPSPQELAYRRRIRDGGFWARGNPQDLLLVVLCETGIPIFALDDDRVRGELGLRRSLAGELQAEDGSPAPPTRRPEPVVVDDEGVVAEVLRAPRPTHVAKKRTTTTRFFGVRVPGLTDMRVDEAVWLCRTLLQHGG